MNKRKYLILACMLLAVVTLVWGAGQIYAQSKTAAGKGNSTATALLKERADKVHKLMDTRKLLADRKAAAKRFKAAREKTLATTTAFAATALDPGGTPHYFGPYPNYAYSPLPTGAVTTVTVENGGSGYVNPTVTIMDVYNTGTGAIATATVEGGVITDIMLTNGGSGYSAPVVYITDDTGTGAAATAAIGGTLNGGIKKFVDSLPGLGEANKNDLGQYLPVAVPDTTTYPGCDYYEIELGRYTEQLHNDLPPTLLQGYRQTNTTDLTVSKFSYLGPMIVAHKDRAVRIKFTNKLPTGTEGNLFLPVDTTIMGAGMGPLDMPGMPGMKESYTQNRATLHLHGGFVPWISDGTPHQWITPAGENTQYPKGVSVVNVPDMPDPGDGSMTFYYNNQQSARLMFYHDHAFGITRLNVYAGEAAGYLITDDVEQDLINGTNNSGVNTASATVLPDEGIPLIIQDKTFVDASTIASQDPTWNWGSTPGTPVTGDLWYPNVYMPNQNPDDISGMNPFGRWHYGPWFWPPTKNITHGPVANPYYDPINAPWEPKLMPGTPDPSAAGEAFMDTPMVNGTVYPYMEVDPKAYRFRILNVADDRFFNLQLYQADASTTASDGRANTEVKMVPAAKTAGFPADWPVDGREGGVPDPATAGPDFIQVGTEGGFLPAPVVLPNQPIDWNMDQTNFDFGNVSSHTLLLGTAERADVIVDFSKYAGKTLILYNDAPAAFPAIDPRYDYYTGHPDQTDIGGTPSTQPGYGPNTRTIMQIRVKDTAPAAPYNRATLEAVFKKTDTKKSVFEASQDPILVPQAGYNSAYNAKFPSNAFAKIMDTSMTFTPLGSTTPVTVPFEPKAIQDEMGEAYDKEYGRMSAMLGVELPQTVAGNQNFVLYGYTSAPVEIVKGSVYGTPIGSTGDGTQIWKITHNGVDTHTIHFHLYNVQLINRVAWDNALRPPDANELGWKETIRLNPLQDAIVAMRPVTPTQPFDVPNSVRLIDPTQPEGAILANSTQAELNGQPPEAFDPLGEPIDIVNHKVNFGWEYVWHCHLLAHEEMDMMHSLAIAVAPKAPSNLAAIVKGNRATLTWADNSLNETGFTIERATNASFTTGLTTFTVGQNVKTYTDTNLKNKQTYYYRVKANNVVGDTWDYSDPNLNEGASFPHQSVDSAFSNTISVIR
ncbi:MAG: hypothetical protein ACYC56_05150 [Candidatus Aquicultor sp.]